MERNGALGWSTCILSVMVGSLARVPQLGHSLTGDHAFRQTQTAFAIRGYAEHGVSLLHSPLPVFGRATDLPLEFPLFQAMARELMRLGLTDSSAGRVAGLVAFQATGVLWWILLRRWHGVGLAASTLVAFEVLPFGLHWGAASLIDFLSVAMGLVMVLGFDSWIRPGRRHRGTALVVCSVGASALCLVKLTTVPGPCALLVLSFALAVESSGWSRTWRRALIGLAAGPAVGFVLLVLWTRHADRIRARFAVTEFMASKNQWSRNFGGTRLSGTGWELIATRTAQEIAGLGCIALVCGLILGLALATRRTRVLTIGLLVSAAAPILVFFNLYAIHSYYLIAVYPSLTAMGALGVVRLWELAPSHAARYAAAPAALSLIWIVSTATSPLGRHDVDDLLHETPAPNEVGQLMSATPPDAKIVTIGCDWDSQYLYLAHRTGLMLRDLDPSDVARIWQQDDIGEYRYLLRCDPKEPIARYLPGATTWANTTEPDVFALHRPPNS